MEPRLVELLKDLNIAHLRKHAAISLSGGERRRLEIARALGTRPAFILLDEPFAGVDPIAVLDIQRIIRFLKERGIGVLITDHNVRETLGICDRAYIINEGAVLASGHPEEIVYNDSVRRVYLGENFGCVELLKMKPRSISPSQHLTSRRAARRSAAAALDGRAQSGDRAHADENPRSSERTARNSRQGRPGVAARGEQP
jgi:ABC-type multidrug transport system ATPase subunit